MSHDIETVGVDIGRISRHKDVILSGECPFCCDKVTFRQLEYDLAPSKIKGYMIAIQCEGCKSVLSYSLNEKKFYPPKSITGLKDLPDEIQKYYEEALRCISADSPNGAVTLFRKIIHALGIHYKIAKKNDNKNLYDIIKKLNEDGHIVPKLKDALIGVKDIGNDGAHINDNEPDMEQTIKIRKLVETVLKSTVITDKDLEFVREKHSGEEDRN